MQVLAHSLLKSCPVKRRRVQVNRVRLGDQMSGGFGGGVLSLTGAGGDPFGGTGSLSVNRSKGIRCWAAGCRLSEAWGSLLRKIGSPQSYMSKGLKNAAGDTSRAAFLLYFEALGFASTKQFARITLYSHLVNIKPHHSSGIRIAGSRLTLSPPLEKKGSQDSANRQANQN